MPGQGNRRAAAVDEATWLACEDPWWMLKVARQQGLASDRKLHLYVAACVRRTLPATDRGIVPRAMAALERHADGAAVDLEGLPGALLRDAAAEGGRASTDDYITVMFTLQAHAWGAAEGAGMHALGSGAGIVRDLWGNPFRPVVVEPGWLSWNEATVPRLAQAAYEGRQLPQGYLDTARLAVLADALEEAGCADPHLLAHLRSPGPHVRGCFAVDALLGRS
jgi:hypothetical protein